MNPEDYKIEKIGNIEKWYCKETNDLRKRIEYWYKNGTNRCEIYYINGKYHREDGPTYQRWNADGIKQHEMYYLNDKKYSKEEYDKIMLAKKFELL
jgi:hypothetical protein